MKWLNQLGLLFLVLFVTVSVQAATLNISVKDAQTGQNLNRASVTITPEVVDAVMEDVVLAADEAKSIEILLSSEVSRLERISVTASRRGEKSYYTIDLNAGYELPIGLRPRLSLTVQNLLDRKHQPFIGTPEIGRLSIVCLTQTF